MEGELTHGSLFTGIGGMDLGFERAGVRTIWQVEREPFCLDVLRNHWPNVERHQDVTRVDWNTVDPPDVISGGFPCQPFSTASRGRAHGTNDDRWLWPPFAEAVAALRPSYVVVENVVGFRRRNTGALHAVLGDLARMGFDAWWGGLRATDAGAPHKRERVFVVGYPHCDSQSVGSIHEEASRLPPSPGHLRDWRMPAPEAVRGDDGVPRGLDRTRVKALGNAVVPQVAQMVGEWIVMHAGGQR